MILTRRPKASPGPAPRGGGGAPPPSRGRPLRRRPAGGPSSRGTSPARRPSSPGRTRRSSRPGTCRRPRGPCPRSWPRTPSPPRRERRADGSPDPIAPSPPSPAPSVGRRRFVSGGRYLMVGMARPHGRGWGGAGAAPVPPANRGNRPPGDGDRGGVGDPRPEGDPRAARQDEQHAAVEQEPLPPGRPPRRGGLGGGLARGGVE